jgi:hypothetical protein
MIAPSPAFPNLLLGYLAIPSFEKGRMLTERMQGI